MGFLWADGAGYIQVGGFWLKSVDFFASHWSCVGTVGNFLGEVDALKKDIVNECSLSAYMTLSCLRLHSNEERFIAGRNLFYVARNKDSDSMFLGLVMVVGFQIMGTEMVTSGGGTSSSHVFKIWGFFSPVPFCDVGNDLISGPLVAGLRMEYMSSSTAVASEELGLMLQRFLAGWGCPSFDESLLVCCDLVSKFWVLIIQEVTMRSSSLGKHHMFVIMADRVSEYSMVTITKGFNYFNVCKYWLRFGDVCRTQVCQAGSTLRENAGLLALGLNVVLLRVNLQRGFISKCDKVGMESIPVNEIVLSVVFRFSNMSATQGRSLHKSNMIVGIASDFQDMLSHLWHVVRKDSFFGNGYVRLEFPGSFTLDGWMGGISDVSFILDVFRRLGAYTLQYYSFANGVVTLLMRAFKFIVLLDVTLSPGKDWHGLWGFLHVVNCQAWMPKNSIVRDEMPLWHGYGFLWPA